MSLTQNKYIIEFRLHSFPVLISERHEWSAVPISDFLHHRPHNQGVGICPPEIFETCISILTFVEIFKE